MIAANKCHPNHRILHRIITSANRTVVQTRKVLGLSDKGMYNVIHNPFKLNLAQLHTLASFLDIPYLELHHLICSNTARLTEIDKVFLESIRSLPADFEEYTIITPKHKL